MSKITQHDEQTVQLQAADLYRADPAAGGGSRPNSGDQRPALTGQLRDAGNTTTLAHYLDLLKGAGLAVGLEKFSSGKVRQRRSSPKLLLLNTALVSAATGRTFAESRADPEHWGRLIETAVGAHLWASRDPRAELLYWRDRGKEVDFVVQRGKKLSLVEVKSGRRRDGLPGMAAFEAAFGECAKLLVGGDGTPLEIYLEGLPDRGGPTKVRGRRHDER